MKEGKGWKTENLRFKKKKAPRFKVVVNQVCVCACVCVCVCVEIAQICTQDKMLTSGGFG